MLRLYRQTETHILWLLHHVETQFWTCAENIRKIKTFPWAAVETFSANLDLVLNLYCAFYSMWRASFEPVPGISGRSTPCFEPMLRLSRQSETWFGIYVVAFTACGVPVLNLWREYLEYPDLVLNLCCNFLGKLRLGFEHILWFLQHVETQFWTSAENIGNNETLFWTYVLVLNLYCGFYSMWRASFEPVPRISQISRPYFDPVLRLSWQI